MGKPAKPLKILQFEGNAKLSKAEIRERAAGEIKLGGLSFSPPPRVRSDPTARAKWKNLMQIYATPHGRELVSSADIDSLASYCLAWSAFCRVSDEYFASKNIDILPEFRKQLEIVTKLSDKLFLNPLARVRNVLKNPPKLEPTQLETSGFGGV